MNFPDIPLFSMLKTQMSWLNQRQDLLTENVANANTPGYVAQDLKPVDFDDALRQATGAASNSSQLAVTDPRHITAGLLSDNGFENISVRDTEASPNGNAVSLEQEMIKVSDTQAQFKAATGLYAKAVSMMKTAIGQP